MLAAGVESKGWFKGRSQPETIVFTLKIWKLPANCPSNQSNDRSSKSSNDIRDIFSNNSPSHWVFPNPMSVPSRKAG
jgi:hypothetical protein